MIGSLFRRRNEADDYYVDERDGRRFSRSALYPRLSVHYIVLAIIGAIIIGAVGLTSGQAMMIKLLLALAAPTGLVWILLFVSAYSLTICRIGSAAVVAWIGWLVLSLAGNSFISSQLILTLEKPYVDELPLESEPFDVVVVLGGGTGTSPNGQPQLLGSGDRVMLAARLVEAGKTKLVICTGSEWQPLVGNDLQVSAESSQILTEFADQPEPVPVIRIKGSNTKQEMESLSVWLDEHPSDRVGLITSAWHLPRAMRLAEANEVEVIPLPADFKSRRFRPDPNLLIPSADNLKTTQLALHEYIARLAGQ